MKADEFHTTAYPPVRLFTADMGRISREKHAILTLLEVDITDALKRIRELREPGKKVSLLAWFIKVLADTVASHPPINGIKSGKTSVVVFERIDVSTIVEKVVDGAPVPLPLVLRGANQKTHYQINNEIQSAVSQTVENEGNYVLGSGENSLLLKLGVAAPRWLRLLIMKKFILGNPRRVQEMMGTVMVSSLGTIGRITGWIIPTSMHPLSLGIGTLNKKPVIHAGKIEPRDILHLTITFDHDVIDGMPARKFVDELVTKLESGAGLG